VILDRPPNDPFLHKEERVASGQVSGSGNDDSLKDPDARGY